MPLHHALRRHADMTPDAIAVNIGSRAIRYAELADRAYRLNTFIANLPRNDRPQRALAQRPVFALLMGNTPFAVEFLVAALTGPCCVVLLDPLLPAPQRADILTRLPPDILVTAGQDPAEFDDCDFPVVAVESDTDLDQLLQESVGAAPPGPDADDPFLVAFTSGTTSRPKAFLRKRRSWRASLEAGRAHFGIGPQTSTLSPGPLAHGLSLYAFTETLEAGATFHALERFSPKVAWSVLKEGALPRLVCVPSALDALCRYGSECNAMLDDLRQVTTSGAKLSEQVLNRLHKTAPAARTTEYYGASELGFVTTVTHAPGPAGMIPSGTGVGRAFPGVEIEIRPNTGSPTKRGVGPIWVKSDLMIDGYLWHDDALAFRRDGDWATVGDLGYLNENGNLELVSRAGGMIISGGNNIYPEEVMTCLRRHPAIKEVSVTGLPDGYLGSKLVAVLSLEDGQIPPTPEDLTRFCRDHLQKYKVPRHYYLASEWPMTSSGKISTGQLADWIADKDTRLVLL